jgi:hypothetical protein
VNIHVTPGDTVAVVVIGPDTVLVDTVRVRARVERLRFAAFVEGAMLGPHTDLGVGLAWKPVSILGAEIGPYVSADVPDFAWASGGARISRRWYSTLEGGFEVGYRIGERAGLHIGVGLGFAF